MDSTHSIEEELTIFVTDIFCVLTTDINHGGDSSKLSLKAGFIHNCNILPSIPVGHSVHNNKSYENMKILIESTNYEKLKCKIYGELKMIALLLGLQKVFTKYCCFICEWDRDLVLFIIQERFGLPENF